MVSAESMDRKGFWSRSEFSEAHQTLRMWRHPSRSHWRTSSPSPPRKRWPAHLSRSLSWPLKGLMRLSDKDQEWEVFDDTIESCHLWGGGQELDVPQADHREAFKMRGLGLTLHDVHLYWGVQGQVAPWMLCGWGPTKTRWGRCSCWSSTCWPRPREWRQPDHCKLKSCFSQLDSNIYSVLVETCENTCYKTALSSFGLYQCLGTTACRYRSGEIS
jgi:hypothetical protein